MNKSNKMLKTASFMTVATLLAKMCGMARDMIIASFYSLGSENVAFSTAARIPTLLFDVVIGGVISATFIPVFNSVLECRSKDEAMDFANKFITMITLITVCLSIAGYAFSDTLVYILGPGLNPDTHNLARELSNIMFPMIIFTGLAFSFVGILQSFGEFNIPAIISLVSNLAIILYFAIFKNRFGIHGLAVTMLVAWSLQMLIQVPSLRKLGFRYKPSLKLNDPNIKHALVLAVPMLVSTWVQPLYTIVNTRLASGLNGGGAIVALDLANKLYIMIVGIFSFVVTNLIFPKLSKANSLNNNSEVKGLIVTSLKAISIIIFPLMAGFIILARPITVIIYEHGIFDKSATSLTSMALMCYSFGMIGMAANEILSKSLFSMQDSKTPMFTALSSMVINIVLAYSLSHFLGVGGLALASACGSTANAILNYIFVKKKFGRLFEKEDFISLSKTLLSALIMSGIVFVLYVFLQNNVEDGFLGNLIIGASCAVVGIISYFAFSYILGVVEIKQLTDDFLKK
ncbi:MAG: murein biosynthesis integral membrane protein MurJ [Clostridia bacterium]|nr:murein biosynthesis integral membrane protein MurJ [Clostridia bacterium]